MNDIRKRINELKGEIEKHNYNYYVLDNPIVSDTEWDDLFKELEDLESEYPNLIDINSPGGSAVQSSLIYDQIMRLKYAYHKKVVVVGEDSLTSGAYLIASAADQIYVDPDTLTCSIGVIMSGFGVTDAI